MSETSGSASKSIGLPQGTSLVKVTSASMHPSSFPLMETPGIAFLLAISAGLLNAWTFAHAKTFATVQSGNVIQVGYQLVAGDWEKFFFSAGSVLAFGLGSFVAGAFIAVALRKHTRYSPSIQGVLVALLGVAVVLIATDAMRPDYIAMLISFAAGMQGNGFHKIKGMLYGNVAVTLVVQLAFNYLMQSFFSKTAPDGSSNLRNSGLYFLVLLGFAGGGAVGFGLDVLWSGLSVIGSMLITLALMGASMADKADPDAN